MKRTRKYIQGLATLQLVASPECCERASRNNYALYGELETRGYRWDGHSGTWTDLSNKKLFSEVWEGQGIGEVRIRVMAHPTDIDEALRRVVRALDAENCVISDVSPLYSSKRANFTRCYLTVRMKVRDSRRW